MRRVGTGAIVVLLGTAGPWIADAYEVEAVASPATISGKVTLKGIPRAPKIFKVDKTPEVCGEEDRILHEVRVQDGRLADAVLFLKGVEKGKPFSGVTIKGPEPGARELTATSDGEYPGTNVRPESCLFGAFTGVVANGKLIRFRNHDPVKHSPHTYAVKGKVRKSMFNLDLEGNGTLDVEVKFKKPKETAMKLECDQHNHMQNWFYRVDNPYFAFSAADGSFTIDGIPPGTYTLIAWHPKFKEKKQQVTLEAGGSISADFEFVSRVRPATTASAQ